MFLALFVKNGKFAYLTLQLTFWPWSWPWVIKIIQEMDCPSQNHMKMRYYSCSWLYLLKNHIWPWNIWWPFCFCPYKIPPKGEKVPPGWFLLRTHLNTRINHKTSSIPQNLLQLQNAIWQLPGPLCEFVKYVTMFIQVRQDTINIFNLLLSIPHF